MNCKSLTTITLACLLGASSLLAGDAKTYQVTGPILALTDTMITVQKGTDRWEINRDANSKITGDLKVGAKVTITYTMSASAIEVKPGKATPVPAAAGAPAAAKEKK